MNIFISWSGLESGKMAEALRKWLPLIIDSPDFWMSAIDIPEGKRWNHELSHQLNSCDIGILIITPQNKTAPWMLFEAGALSKNVKEGRVIPYLLGVEKNDLPSPLSQFQAITANQQDTFRLVSAINKAMPKPSDNEVVNKRYKALWPQIQSSIEGILKDISKVDLADNESESVYKNGELVKLHKELSETKEIIKELVKNINFSTIGYHNGIENDLELKEFEGSWIDSGDESHLYMKIMNSKLVAPYCYRGNDELTAEYYGWKKIGEYWYARFRWFNSDIKGFAFYKITSNNIIEGNWWYDADMPTDITMIDHFDGQNIDGGNPVKWERIQKSKIPLWAEKFISKYKNV